VAALEAALPSPPATTTTGTDRVSDWYMQTITPLNGPRSAMTVYPLGETPCQPSFEKLACARCAQASWLVVTAIYGRPWGFGK
jgi:hypothetical protein